MPADTTATHILKVAVMQPCLTAFFRKAVHHTVAAAMILNCTLLQAADLPQTYSDTSPAAENSLSQRPILQTNSKVLPVDSAFALTSFIEADTSIVLKWEMPPGYYLYQKSLAVENVGATAINPELPEATKITDEFFGEVAVYYNSLLIRLPFAVLNARPGTTIDLLLTYQGCAEALYCYPPEQKALTLTLPE
jgi:thiol:disulfide interchange protein